MGGSPDKPDPPPPAPAPVRADSAGGEQALLAANRRKGLRSTILSAENEAATLGAPTALGAMGQLGMGGQDGVMVNTKFAKPPQNKGGGRWAGLIGEGTARDP